MVLPMTIDILLAKLFSRIPRVDLPTVEFSPLD